jgi:hypothetical protein
MAEEQQQKTKKPVEDPDEVDDDLDEIDDDDDDDLDEIEDKTVKVKQSRMTQLLTREKKVGIKAGRKAVLKELGFDTLDAAKAKLSQSETKKPTDDASDEKDKEAQRTRDAETAKVQHEAKISKAESLLTRRLTMAKVDPNKLDAAIKIMDAEEHVESDADEVDAAIEELQEKMPEFFLSEDDDEDGDKPRKKTSKRPATKSNPGGAPRKKGEPSAADRVTSRLQRRHGSKMEAAKKA